MMRAISILLLLALALAFLGGTAPGLTSKEGKGCCGIERGSGKAGCGAKECCSPKGKPASKQSQNGCSSCPACVATPAVVWVAGMTPAVADEQVEVGMVGGEPDTAADLCLVHFQLRPPRA